MSGLIKVLETHQKVIKENYVNNTPKKFTYYAVSNLRGGVGKSSIAFNLSYEISRNYPLLVTDVCPQCACLPDTPFVCRGHRIGNSWVAVRRELARASSNGIRPDKSPCDLFRGRFASHER